MRLCLTEGMAGGQIPFVGCRRLQNGRFQDVASTPFKDVQSTAGARLTVSTISSRPLYPMVTHGPANVTSHAEMESHNSAISQAHAPDTHQCHHSASKPALPKHRFETQVASSQHMNTSHSPCNAQFHKHPFETHVRGITTQPSWKLMRLAGRLASGFQWATGNGLQRES